MLWYYILRNCVHVICHVLSYTDLHRFVYNKTLPNETVTRLYKDQREPSGVDLPRFDKGPLFGENQREAKPEVPGLIDHHRKSSQIWLPSIEWSAPKIYESWVERSVSFHLDGFRLPHGLSKSLVSLDRNILRFIPDIGCKLLRHPPKRFGWLQTCLVQASKKYTVWKAAQHHEIYHFSGTYCTTHSSC